MDNLLDLTMIQKINELFWHSPFYVVLYLASLLSLVLFWKTMKRGRRLFFAYSILCLVLFIYNPISVNLIEEYLLNNELVAVRLFLILPLVFTEAYVFANLVLTSLKKSRIVASILTVLFVFLLFGFGITPWQRAEKGWGVDMYLPAENLYKIPQEHLNIADAILNDMDGDRTILSLYEFHEKNDIGGTLNFSIRMYTSRIQLNTVIDAGTYNVMTTEEKTDYWDKYMYDIQNKGTDSSSFYFIFPIGDVRATDLIEYGCFELPVDSSNYQVLVYTP